MKARWLALLFACVLPNVWAGSEHHIRLSNGLSVYVIEDHRAKVVYSSLWYQVGSADEVDGYTGLSHMLEHMLFRGTETTKDGEYADTIHRLGGQMNAMTTQDFTMYHSFIPVNGLAQVLKLEADRMRHLVITQALLKREKEVVQEERQMRVTDNPARVLQERLDAAAFVTSPYHHPVVGWPGDVAGYTLSDVKNWYDAWYHPNNATLVLVGDITPEAGFSLAKTYFEKIPRGALPERKHREEIPPLGKKRLLVHYPANVATLSMAYLTPGLPQAKPAWRAYALEVLAGILDATPSARLNQHLVRDRTVAAVVSADYNPLERFDGLFLIEGTPAHTHSMAEVEQAITEEIEQLKKEPVSRAELNQVKAQVIAHAIYRQDELESQAMMVGVPVMVGLPSDISEQWVQQIEAITPKQVQWVAQHYLVNNRLTVGYLEPTAIR